MEHDVRDHLMHGVAIYSEISASSSMVRAWVGIYPFKGELFGPRPAEANQLPWRYRIRTFEVDKFLTDNDYDVHEEELKAKAEWVVDSVEEVFRIIAQWPAIALVTHHDDYPI